MNISKLLIFLWLLAVATITNIGNIANAFDVNVLCANTPDLQKGKGQTTLESVLLAKLKQYPNNVTPAEDGTYVICFAPSQAISITQPITLTASATAPLLIYGLNLKMASAPADPCTSALITISGAGVALQNATFAGPGSCTAIQVNGTAAIENSTISSFTEGIKIAKEASVKLAKNAFAAFEGESGFLNAVLFDAGVISPLDAGLLGKKVSEKDPTMVELITGKLNLQECVGGVEMNYRYEKDNIIKLQPHPTAACTVAVLAEDTKLKFGVQDGEEKEETILKDTCAFKCADFSEGISTQVTFAYTSAYGQTYPFTPMSIKKFSELGNVISVSAVPGYIPTTSGADGADSGTTVYIAGYETGADSANQGADASNVDSNDVLVNPNLPPPEDTPDSQADDGVPDVQTSDDESGEKNLVTQGVSASPIGGCSLIR